MFITTEDYKKVSSLTFSDSIKDFKNYEQIEKSEKCGCFSCCEIFTPSEITDYIPDEPPTAECPFCNTDSVIGDASGFPITKDFLKKMKKRWFQGIFSMFSSIFLPYLMGAVSVLKTDIKISFTAKAQSKLPKISNAPLVCSLSAHQRGLLSFICYFVRRQIKSKYISRVFIGSIRVVGS